MFDINIAAGTSIGVFQNEGTLGFAVKDRNAKRYGMTCSHVAAPWFKQPNKDPVFSLDHVGTGGSRQMIATVTDWTIINVHGVNTADAALIQLQDGVDVSNTRLQRRAPLKFFEGRLEDYDAMRSQTVSVISAREAIPALINGVENNLVLGFSGRLFRFANVLSYSGSFQPGDSGAAVVDSSSQILGLHFAGERSGRLGYCITMLKILEAFQEY